MIRVLAMIAGAGFVLSVGCLAAALAVGGPDALAHSSWNLISDNDDWQWRWEDHDHHRHGRHGRWSEEAMGPQTTRTLAWSGSESLDLDLAADVRYIQADGPGSVVITGPQRALEHVELRGGNLGYDGSFRHQYFSKVQIVVRAPNVSRFDVSGLNSLSIEDYRQTHLSVDVSGNSEVTASGQADDVELDISGSGDVDLGALKTKGAKVKISGAGDATIAPTDWAELGISGMGDVRLLTHPAKLETDISGAGKVRQEGGGPASPSPSPTPSPSPKGGKT